MNKQGEITILCIYCGNPTRLFGTQKCNSCWGLSHIGMENNKTIAKILIDNIPEKDLKEIINLLETINASTIN